VKAIGVELDDRHVKQAIDYGTNQGVEWVMLTNGVVWRVNRTEAAQRAAKTAKKLGVEDAGVDSPKAAAAVPPASTADTAATAQAH